MYTKILIFLSLLTLVQSFLHHHIKMNLNNKLKMASSSSSSPNETDDEMRDRLRKKVRKNYYNEDGVAYAPWMQNNIDEDAIVEALMRKEKGIKDPSNMKTKTSILDRGEIESSEGMKWRMSNNQVDLVWITGKEENNKGFIVLKRPSYGGEFQEIASFKEVATLQSKGINGGRYRYIDALTAPGSWIYCIKDCDNSNNNNVLCQCFVEVQTDTESKIQYGLAVGLLGFFIAVASIGYSLDPPM